MKPSCVDNGLSRCRPLALFALLSATNSALLGGQASRAALTQGSWAVDGATVIPNGSADFGRVAVGYRGNLVVLNPPPTTGEDLVRQMHDRYEGKWYKTLTFIQRTTFPGRPDQTWYETAQLPGKLRIDIAPLDSMRAVLFIGDSTFRFRGGKPLEPRAGGNPLALLLADVYASPAEESIARIKRFGFDLSRTRSGEWRGRPVWVVGTTTGDTTVSQFWIDKERLYVVRIIEHDAGQPVVDTHISGHQPAGQGWVEGELHFFRDGVEFQGEYYRDVRVNPPLDPGIWSSTTWKRPAWADSAASEGKAEVLGTIHSFLAAMKVRDTASMALYTDTLTRMTLLRPGPNGPRIFLLKGSDFIRLVAQPNQPAFDEPIRNPVVQVDGDLASVWAEYQVRRDGVVTHCGYDAFQLARLGGKWKILSVSDNMRTVGCGDSWPQ